MRGRIMIQSVGHFITESIILRNCYEIRESFEILVRYITINMGFMEVVSDGLYISGKATCQKINGLGEVHDADVLLEPPAQMPFYPIARLLVECKDFSKRKNQGKVGLDVVGGKWA